MGMLAEKWFLNEVRRRAGERVATTDGNVRELENVIERAMILSREPVRRTPPSRRRHQLASKISNNGTFCRPSH
jgi:DNA-binding NtrC family response regulator